MKLETLSFQEILKRTPDIFEAVTVLGERAIQIIGRRAAEQVVGEEVYPEDEYAIEELPEENDYEEEDKATVVAMEDFLEKRLEWRYTEKETGDELDESGKTTSD